MALEPVNQAQFVVTMGSLSARFTTATGFEATRTEDPYNDGQTSLERKHLGFTSLTNVTLGKPYSPGQDRELEQAFKNARDTGSRETVAIQAVDTTIQGQPLAGTQTLVLTDCQIKTIKYPAIDRNGSGVAMSEIEVVPGDYTTQ
jgi:hypothetical protein